MSRETMVIQKDLFSVEHAQLIFSTMANWKGGSSVDWAINLAHELLIRRGPDTFVSSYQTSSYWNPMHLEPVSNQHQNMEG